MITGRQIREARALLGWGAWRLAKSGHLSVKLLAKLEGAEAIDFENEPSAARIKLVLETAGCVFSDVTSAGPSVRLDH